MTFESTILLGSDGAYVNEAEIKNTDGSYMKVKLKGDLLIIRVLDRGSLNKPSMKSQFIISPYVPEPTIDPTLILVSRRPGPGETVTVSVKVQVTWSFTLLVSVRLKNMIGDLSEEYIEKQRRQNKAEALGWLLSQVVGSIVPILWQVFRYDIPNGWSAWRVWRLFETA